MYNDYQKSGGIINYALLNYQLVYEALAKKYQR